MLQCHSFTGNDVNQMLCGDESVLFSKYMQILLFVEEVQNYMYFFQDYFLSEDLEPHCYVMIITFQHCLLGLSLSTFQYLLTLSPMAFSCMSFFFF